MLSRMQNQLNMEISEEQAGFRPGRGTTNQIFNLKMVMEKSYTDNKDLYMCFIDYSKAFDTIIHNELWKAYEILGFSAHLTELIKRLYQQQKACVKTMAGMTEWFDIERGVRQGCILSPSSFNIIHETAMRKALEGHNCNVKVGGREISNLRYADDVSLLAESFQEVEDLLDRVDEASRIIGLHLNVKKTKMMIVSKKTLAPERRILINEKPVEVVYDFDYLGYRVNSKLDDTIEIRKRLAIAKVRRARFPTYGKTSPSRSTQRRGS